MKSNIQTDVTNALKQGNQELAQVLRLILASISAKEKEKRYKISKENPGVKQEDIQKQSELTDDEVLSVLSSEVKKRKDAIVLYEKGNRPELAEKEKQEVQIIQKYLPEQLSEEELKRMIKDAVMKVGAKEMKDIRKVMAELTPNVKGKADTSEISKMIKELLIV